MAMEGIFTWRGGGPFAFLPSSYDATSWMWELDSFCQLTSSLVPLPPFPQMKSSVSQKRKRENVSNPSKQDCVPIPCNTRRWRVCHCPSTSPSSNSDMYHISSNCTTNRLEHDYVAKSRLRLLNLLDEYFFCLLGKESVDLVVEYLLGQVFLELGALLEKETDYQLQWSAQGMLRCRPSRKKLIVGISQPLARPLWQSVKWDDLVEVNLLFQTCITNCNMSSFEKSFLSIMAELRFADFLHYIRRTSSDIWWIGPTNGYLFLLQLSYISYYLVKKGTPRTPYELMERYFCKFALYCSEMLFELFFLDHNVGRIFIQLLRNSIFHEHVHFAEWESFLRGSRNPQHKLITRIVEKLPRGVDLHHELRSHKSATLVFYMKWNCFRKRMVKLLYKMDLSTLLINKQKLVYIAGMPQTPLPFKCKNK